MTPGERLYIVGRRDLPPGLQASQAVHAAQAFQAAHPELTAAWMDGANRVVLLVVDDDAALGGVLERALARGLRAVPFSDDDLPQPLGAVAIEPSEAARAFCRGLKLAFAQG